jgi:ethanolamine utilization cobalamin adenosyltransferase
MSDTPETVDEKLDTILENQTILDEKLDDILERLKEFPLDFGDGFNTDN